jgi:hypothetical protein
MDNEKNRLTLDQIKYIDLKLTEFKETYGYSFRPYNMGVNLAKKEFGVVIDNKNLRNAHMGYLRLINEKSKHTKPLVDISNDSTKLDFTSKDENKENHSQSDSGMPIHLIYNNNFT